jgi:uncharacterized protein (TIGR02271 family)
LLTSGMARKNTIPRVEERLSVGKRTVVAGRVRVRKTVRRRTESLEIPLARETAVVRRVPVNRVVPGPVPVRQQGSVTIVPVLEEVPVLTTQLVLKEELHIEMRSARVRARRDVVLHSENVEVTRDPERPRSEWSSKAVSRFSTNVSGANHMASTLAGVFDDYDDAEQARKRLTAAGFRREAIQVTPERSAWGTGDASYGGRIKQPGGLRGFFAELFGIGNGDRQESHEQYSEAVRRGGIVVTVDVDADAKIVRATEILEDCGAIDVDKRAERWKAAGYAGYDEQAKPMTRDEIARDRDTLQVIQEDLKVGKRAVQRGSVRVHTRLTEKPVQEQVTLNEERAVVERRPVDRPASAADLAAFKEGEMEIRETSEEPVVSKSARVVEEVSVGKESEQRTETVSDSVRRTDVDVERTGAEAKPRRAGKYDGVERRKNRGQYAGVERRAAV